MFSIFFKKNKQKQPLFFKDRAAFTLIEVLIALAVFTIGIVAAMSLAIANFNNSRLNLERITAANLAREGVELVRNIRDSNWLRQEDNETSCGGTYCNWDYGIDVNSDYVYLDYQDSVVHAVTATVGCATGINQCNAECSDCNLYRDSDDFYVNDSSVGNTATAYSRILSLKKICTDESSADPHINEYTQVMSLPCGAGDDYIGIEITSNVRWGAESDEEFTVVDRLYNWRR